MGPIYSLDDFLEMVLRHFRLISGLVLLGGFVSLIYAQNQQHAYRASETIQIERPQIADDLAASTVAGSSARRLQLIEQQIMSRSSLLDIIADYGLYADLPALTDSEKVIRLRQSVSINGVAAVREGYADDGTISLLTITAEMPTPELAQQIATEFSRRTIAASSSSRLEQSRATLDFFTRREDRLRTEIAALEDRIAAFRADNEAAVGGSVEFSRAEIGTLNQSILGLERERIGLERQRAQIDGSTRRASTAERERADIDAQIAAVDRQTELLQARVRELQATIQTSPEIERTMIEFQRERDQLQSQLDIATARRTEAEIGLRLESAEKAERLTVIEAASVPDYPFTSSRKKTAAMGLAASILAALGLAFLLDLRKPVIRTAAQMERETGLTPVVSIPVMKAKPLRPSRLRRLRAALGGGRRSLPGSGG
ncbi:DUF874 domain-containing protein [Oceaniglobus indicus]|uniref:DUF874 domain-containing protein n=1 Tax=Oceaniglobus indicus TaxID=2047749 RepID=UPI000C1A4835|nr:DUF874 domain-containing protein [Oceaniglobus indicus]